MLTPRSPAPDSDQHSATSSAASSTDTVVSAKPVIEFIAYLEQGKHGVTGLARRNGKLCVFKIPRNLNFSTHHEYALMRDLSPILKLCPHFCAPVALETLSVHANYVRDCKANKDPFRASQHGLMLDVLFMEYIEDAVSLADLMEDEDVPTHVLMSIHKQVMVAMHIAYKICGFVHYDLHPNNVLVQMCKEETVFIYTLPDDDDGDDGDEERIICIPSHGYCARIIDYNFGSSFGAQFRTLYQSMEYLSKGFLYPACDAFADLRLFLITSSYDLCAVRAETSVEKYRNFVKHLFLDKPVHMKSGWDLQDTDEMSCIDSIHAYLASDFNKSPFWTKNGFYALTTVLCALRGPVQVDPCASLRAMRRGWLAFMQAFEVVEELIDNDFFILYALRQFTQVAFNVRELYVDADSHDAAVATAKNVFLNDIQRFVRREDRAKLRKRACIDTMLCGLYLFLKHAETRVATFLKEFCRKRDTSFAHTTSADEMFDLVMELLDESVVNEDAAMYCVVDARTMLGECIQWEQAKNSRLNERNK